jgi:hypothetical protein
MGKHTFLSVLGVSIVLILLGSLISPQIDDSDNLGFPWQVEVMADGGTRVFQIHLGKTSLAEAEQLFEDEGELTLFYPPEGKPAVEAYFDNLIIGRLKAKLVVSFSIPDQDLEDMYNRGIRVSKLGSGTLKVTLHPDDVARAREEKITAITYLPSINLEAGLIEKRFGMPDDRIKDSAGGGVHWLYAEKGVDVMLSEEEKEVVQYVMPKNFAALVEPLRQQSEETLQ